MSQSDTALTLRQALASAERSGAGRPYPRHLRERAASYVRVRRDEGIADEQIGRELGLSAMTFRRWVGARPKAFVPAVVVESPSPRSFIVHGPRGVRIEGLDLQDLADLLGRLS